VPSSRPSPAEPASVEVCLFSVESPFPELAATTLGERLRDEGGDLAAYRLFVHAYPFGHFHLVAVRRGLEMAFPIVLS
jgi:hypothetical protein